MAFLSIDIGTSVAKVLAFDECGHLLAQARVTYEIHRPKPGWAEQDPEEWWQAVVQATRSVVALLSELQICIDVISLTGQMHGLVLLGNSGKPLLPCLIWMDSRAQKESDLLNDVFGREQLLNLTGNISVPAFPAAKLLWVREYFPKIFKNIDLILLPKDYIGFRLTGKVATDPSDASGTLLYNLKSGWWDEELVKWIGLPMEVLPPIINSTEVVGRVTVDAARDLNIPSGIPVVIGAGDLVTSALGIGIINVSRIGINLGTAGQLLSCVDQWPDALLSHFYIFSHAIPKLYLVLGTIPTGGAALSWLAKVLTNDEHAVESHVEELLKLAEEVPPGAHGLVFLPYLAGTGTPHMNYQAKGAFIGLTEAHGPSELARAVMEGVAYSLRDSLEFIRTFGFRISELRVAGGATRGKLWLQILADVLRVPLYITKTVDASPFGAFLLSTVGINYYRDIIVCESLIKFGDTIFPTENVECYEKGYEIFRNLRQVLVLKQT